MRRRRVFWYNYSVMYQTPFFITGETGNNTFSFHRRQSLKLYVPSLIQGGIVDVRVGSNVVFEDFDEQNQLRSCVGLEHFVRTTHPRTGKPVVIVDNHNHVFYFWHEARSQNHLQNGSTLIHIDQHKDSREPEKWLTCKESTDLKTVFDYTNFELNVGNYISPAIKTGLIGKVKTIAGEADLKQFHPQKHDSLIVNIDLDFWAPEMDYIDHNLSIRKTQEWMLHADLVTIATSPFFIDQERALDTLRCLFSNTNHLVAYNHV